MRLPRGFRFHPEASELIEYLQEKVEGRPDDASQGVINDGIDVYGRSPEQLLGDSILHDDGRSFFFTPIKYRKGKFRHRSTPGGHWKSKNKKAKFRDGEGRTVGYVQDLCYHHGKERSKWLMKEYTLVDDLPKMALCVIYCAQNKRKDRIQGNEWRMKSLKVEEATDSESKDIRLHYLSNDWSSSEKPTGDECRQYLKAIAEETGESYDKIIFMARNLGTVGAPKFSKPDERVVGPSEEDGGFFSSKNPEVYIAMESSQFPSAPATSAGNSIGGDLHAECNSGIPDTSDSLDLDEFWASLDFLSQTSSPSVHAVAPSKEGGSAEAAACPEVLPDTIFDSILMS